MVYVFERNKVLTQELDLNPEFHSKYGNCTQLRLSIQNKKKTTWGIKELFTNFLVYFQLRFPQEEERAKALANDLHLFLKEKQKPLGTKKQILNSYPKESKKR